jgi:pyruvoyl-dependent arginine decarboxylase (PvlArgDC)
MSDIDLGNAPEEFDPFANEDDLADDTGETSAAGAEAPPPAKTAESLPPSHPKPAKAAVVADNTAEETGNPLADAIGAAETKDAEKARQSIYEKPPVFDYAGATENIEDSAQTFDELRIAKAADFPELEDGKRVSWTVEYGKLTKTVTDAKGMSIGKMKADIEKSKDKKSMPNRVCVFSIAIYLLPLHRSEF